MNWNLDNKILLQGCTLPDALLYIQSSQNTGTDIVAIISAGDGGQEIGNCPVFDLVEEAIASLGKIETTLIFNPAYEVLDAAYEAIASGVRQIIIASSGVPPLDLLQLLQKAETKNALVLGPGNAGIIVPEKICLGQINPKFYQPGEVAIINRGHCSLSYEVALGLNRAGFGTSIAINLGNEDIIGMSISQWLEILAHDRQTRAIVLIISDPQHLEEKALADYLTNQIHQPIIAYLFDKHSLKSLSRQGTSKMIVDHLPFFSGLISSLADVINTLSIAGVAIAQTPAEIPDLVKQSIHQPTIHE